METILGDVLTWSWFSEPHGYNFNSLLIRDPDGNICIDPVEPNDDVMSELVRIGVSRILHHEPESRARRKQDSRAHRRPYLYSS